MTKIADRVYEQTRTTGTSDAVLLGPLVGYQSFADGCGTGTPFYYVIAHPTLAQWEVGTSNGVTLVGSDYVLERTTVLASSNAGSKVNFSAGLKDVRNTIPASLALALLDVANCIKKDGSVDFTGNQSLGGHNLTSVGTINKVTITAPATGSTLTLADGKTATFNNTLTLSGTDGSTLNVGAGGTLAALAYKSAVDCSTADVTGTLAAGRFPALTGDVTNSAGSLATTIANHAVTYGKMQQVGAVSLVGNPTGSTANASEITLGNSLAFTSTVLDTIQDLRTSANPTFANLTVTKLNKVTITAPATGSTLTVADGKTATINNTLTLSGTDGSTLNVGAGGTLAALAYKSAVDCSTSDVTGTLAAGRFPALTGDVTTTAGSLATTIANNAVTYAKFQQVAAVSLVGNATGSTANAAGITLGSSLTFSGSTVNTIQGIRTADTPQFTRLGVGTAATTTEGVKSFTSTSGGAFQNGTYGANTFDSSCTTLGCGMQFAGATAAAAFTLATAVCYEAGDWALGAGSAITNLIGFDSAALTKGGTLNLGFRGQVTSGATGGFNCYMSGTAPNYFAGDVRIGSSSAAYKLTVTATSNLARFQYDTSNRCDLTVTSSGDTTLTAVGTNASMNLATTGTGGVQVNGGSKLLKHLTATASLSGFGSIAAQSSATQTITVTGAAVGDDVSVSPNGSLQTGLTWCAYVSATDTVTVVVANCSSGALSPTTRTWRAVVRSF